MNRMQQGSGGRTSSVASRILGDSPLADTAPEFHAEATSAFVGVVRSRLVQNAMGELNDADQTVRLLGERLAARNAGPDDIVRILTTSVTRQRQQLTPTQFGPFVREARLALIELMGYVLANYRRHAAVGQARHDQVAATQGIPRDNIESFATDDVDVAISIDRPVDVASAVGKHSDHQES